MARSTKLATPVLLLSILTICGCEALRLHSQDVQSLLVPTLRRSEVFGLVAGFGTTFAGLPDLVVMLRRRSSTGMKPRMAAIMAMFQILWVYYGLLIVSRPIVAWNAIAVLVNLLTVAVYFYFARREPAPAGVRG